MDETSCGMKVAPESRPLAGQTRKNGHPHDEAFVTMVTNDNFVTGVEVTLYSLREHCRVHRPMVVMVTPQVSALKRKSIELVADEILEVGVVVDILDDAIKPLGYKVYL